jgi:hypothetical protein
MHDGPAMPSSDTDPVAIATDSDDESIVGRRMAFPLAVVEGVGNHRDAPPSTLGVNKNWIQ